MKRIVLIFGLLAGAIVAGIASITVPLTMNGTLPWGHSEVVGYTIMLLAFTMIFFGIRSYRENLGGGAITFGRAFTVGILITLVASAIYVVTWEIVYFNFIPDFPDKYAAYMVQQAQSRGASASEIAAMQKQMSDFKEMYKNPLINIGFTLLEIVPVGLIVTLVSAAILRKRTPARAPAAVMA